MNTVPTRPEIDSETKLALEKSAQKTASFLSANHRKALPIKAKFPRGFIRKICDIDQRWPYLTRPRRRTLACVIQLCDVNRFHLNTWDLSLTAGSMWQWHSTMPVAALIETLLYEVGVQEGWLKVDSRFKKAIDTLNSKRVYDESIKKDLHKLREYRNEVHLFLKTDEVEMHDGKPKKYNDAVILLHKVEARLKAYFEKKKS